MLDRGREGGEEREKGVRGGREGVGRGKKERLKVMNLHSSII